MKYVYLLRSLSNPAKVYTGLTDDVARRLEEHNTGKSRFTAHHVPWKIEVAIGFEDEQRAAKFERIAFARKHLY